MATPLPTEASTHPLSGLDTFAQVATAEVEVARPLSARRRDKALAASGDDETVQSLLVRPELSPVM